LLLLLLLLLLQLLLLLLLLKLLQLVLLMLVLGMTRPLCHHITCKCQISLLGQQHLVMCFAGCAEK
jgi:hypothetical protein